MHVELHQRYRELPAAREAQDLIRACVHCGFCTATCPTYLELGDERDGPRGRIHLLMQVLEGGPVSERTQRHLDRCLTCRSCETTCPSGVRYGRLADIGRGLLEQRVPRRRLTRLQRWLLRKVIPNRRLFGMLTGVGYAFRPVLPAALKAKLPERRRPGRLPAPRHERRMLLLDACAQAAATPATNAAAIRVLDRLGIHLESVPGAGCCGAISQHLSAHDEALDHMRRNIDAWWPAIELGAEAVVSTASGCGLMLKEYGPLLANDPGYAGKAAKISALALDLAEVVAAADLDLLAAPSTGTFCSGPGSTWRRHRSPTCAADPPALIQYCSRSSAAGWRRASSRRSASPVPTSSQRPTSAARYSCRAFRTGRSATGSNCSTADSGQRICANSPSIPVRIPPHRAPQLSS
jgi:glycolate oxidase iron-sulfur subunit